MGNLAIALDDIDVKYARSKNITVCNLGGYSTEAVSEFFFAALLEHGRELEKAKNQARNKDFSFDKFMGMELKDKTLGVLGAGRIVGRIAQIGIGFGMKVNYFSKTDKLELNKLVVIKMELDVILKKSDVDNLALSLNIE